MRYSIFQIMLFTAIVGIVFGLAGAWGVPLVIFAATALLVQAWGRLRETTSLVVGGLVGAAAHLAMGLVLVGLDQMSDMLLVLTAHVIPGAYLGGLGAVLRQCSQLAAIDAPMKPPAPIETQGGSPWDDD